MPTPPSTSSTARPAARWNPACRTGSGRCSRAYAAGTCPTRRRSEEHTSELQSLMRISYAVFCLKKKTRKITTSRMYYMQNNTNKTYHKQKHQVDSNKTNNITNKP